MEQTAADHLSGSPEPALNRDAIAIDTAAVLSLLRTSRIWSLLDQLTSALLGQDLTRLSSDVSASALHELTDDELQAILVAGMDRLAGYLGLAPRAPIDPDAVAALERIRDLVLTP